MEIIETKNAPLPKGHYSQAVIHNGIIYISGQLPVNPETGENITGSIEQQARQVMSNLKAILESAGSELSKVLKCNIFISDIEYWGDVNRVYAEFFGNHKPARLIVPVKELHFGFKIEMDAIAVEKD